MKYKALSWSYSLKKILLTQFGSRNRLFKLYAVIAMFVLGLFVGSLIVSAFTLGHKVSLMDLQYLQASINSMMLEVVKEEELTHLYTHNLPETIQSIHDSAIFKKYIANGRPFILSRNILTQEYNLFDTLGALERLKGYSIERTPSHHFFPVHNKVVNQVDPWEGAKSPSAYEIEQLDKHVKEYASKIPLTEQQHRYLHHLSSGVPLNEFLRTHSLKEHKQDLSTYLSTDYKNSLYFASPEGNIQPRMYIIPHTFAEVLTYVSSQFTVSKNYAYTIPLHQVQHETLFLQLSGKSVLYLYDPLQTEHMYWRKTVDNQEVVSPINPLNPKTWLYRFQNARATIINVEPGTGVYIPAFYWVFPITYKGENEVKSVVLQHRFAPHSSAYGAAMKALTKENGPLAYNHHNPKKVVH